MAKTTTEQIFSEIQANDAFLSNYIYHEQERIKASIQIELLKAVHELIAELKGGGR